MRSSVVLLSLLAVVACKRVDPAERGKKVLHFGIRSAVSSLDPIHASNEYTNVAQSLVYEPLLQYDYLVRPLVLRPLLITAMPVVSEDQKTYTFELRDDVRFQHDAAFEGGVGRVVTSTDVVYSLKRMANPANKPKGWWLYAGRIVGFDAYKKAQAAAEAFDYDAPVEGLEIIDARTFRIHLVEPYPQLLYVLAMTYSAVVPREVVEKHGAEFPRRAVGTGPFIFKRWVPGVELVFEKNTAYRDVRYPEAPTDTVVPAALRASAGRRVPFLDGVHLHVFAQEQPMWLKWRVGDLDLILVPSEYQPSLFDESWNVRPQFVREGIDTFRYERLDLVFRGFNMEDPLVGGFGSGRLLRRALSLAYDGQEIGDAFYASAVTHYDGPIPPGLDGYEPGVTSAYRGPNIEGAKKLLAAAGYPNGKGLPPLSYHAHRGGSSPEQAEMLSRQWAKIGVKLDVHLHSFPELDRRIKQKKAPIFSLAWGSDYPDAENNLAMFYGPNHVPGSNHFNYRRPEFDTLYEKTRVMMPSAERTADYEKMRQMVIDDVPYLGGFARARYYGWNKRVKNIRPNEIWWTWLRNVDVEPRY